MLVYLAGPITGTTYAECTDWRNEAAAVLEDVGIYSASPMRAKAYLADPKGGVIKQFYNEHPLSTQHGIMERDRFDVTRADAILVNLLGTTRVSVGTVMEIAWAHLQRKPVIVAIEAEGNPHDHPMTREAFSFRVESIAEAVQLTKLVLLPGV